MTNLPNDDLSVRRAKPKKRGSGRWLTMLPFAFTGLVGVGLILAGLDLLDGVTPQAWMLMTGGIGIFLCATLAPIAWMLTSMGRSNVSQSAQKRLDEIAGGIRSLHEQAALSDDARRVLNRRSERELLCRTIEQDIEHEDWDAGVVLCSELADRFGYRTEAEEYRSRIERARSAVLDHKVTDAVARLDGMIVQRKWDEAMLEAGRIQRLFPDSPRVENLRKRVEQASRVYKADLERRFLDCAHAEQAEEAMELLKELDAYLTEEEAEPYREVARGVIGKARDNLGAKFKIAVHDKRWGDAATLGRRIIKDFPNTRMAHEVRQMLDAILSKANNTDNAPVA